MATGCSFCGATSGPFVKVEGLFTVLMCADCQAARGHGSGPYPVMTRTEMRAGLNLMPTWALQQKAAGWTPGSSDGGMPPPSVYYRLYQQVGCCEELGPAREAAMEAAVSTLFRDVRVFDSRTGRLGGPSQVLVQGAVVQTVAPADAPPPPSTEAVTVIEGAGRTLLPGLIDAHWHTVFASVPITVAMTADPGYLQLVAGRTATETLLRGFTSVRDAGGPAFGLKRAIDTGVITGPRIFPSGAFISQTGGHGDFRAPAEVPRGRLGHLSNAELLGAAAIADGVDAVLQAAREQLMLGASQLKLMVGGGVASPYDPLDVTQYTEAELHAAVEAAENWGTYVMVHAYTPRAVQRAIRAGVKCIEHGHLLDEPTVQLMADNQVWWSMQPFLDDEDVIPVPGPSRTKQLEVIAGTDTAYQLGKKHGVRIAWGTDTLFDPHLATRQGAQLAKLVRWFSPAEVLTMATATNADLLALSGPRNPYPGTLGVVEEGALADLLLVDGNPLEDITLLGRPDTSLVAIMKDGNLVKNTLATKPATSQ